MLASNPAPPRDCSFRDSDWRILARFWHPVAYSTQVAERPFGAQLLDEALVLYRTSRGIVAARDLCLHRGARLSLGWMDADRLVCGFHGFHYDPSGACVKIPAHPGAAIPRRLCLDTFPTVERYGLVWVCLAGDASAPLPDWPEMDSGSLDLIAMPPLAWDASAGRHTENFNDVAHLSWVHTGTFGHRETPEIERYDVREDPFRLSMAIEHATQHDRDPYGKLPDRICPVRYEETVDLPFASRLLVDYKDGRRLYFFDVAAPSSAGSCQIFVFIGRNFALEEPAQSFIDYNLAVLREDRPFVESQCPQDLPIDLQREVHIPADLFSIRYRQKLAALGLSDGFSA